MENRKKIFNCEDEKFKEIIAKSRSYRDVVRLILNDELLDDSIIRHISFAHKNDLLEKIKKLELDISHFKNIYTTKVDLDEILGENIEYPSNRLKKILYREELKEEKCEACGIGSVWRGGPLAHQLDHINGDNKDNRIENLRILCAICHSQTSTYCTGQRDNSHLRAMRNKIFICEDHIFKEIVAKSKTYSQIIRLLFSNTFEIDKNKIGCIANYYKKDISNKIDKLNLSVSHFNKEYVPWNKVDLKKILVFDPKNKRSGLQIKHLLFREKIKEEVCELCSLGNEYNGLPFAMQLDHINGNNKDNRIENLRILCPNCHSQTSTYCSGQSFNPSCKPSKEQLLEDIKQFKSATLISEKYNICHRNIRNWIKAEGLYEIYLEMSKSTREPKKEYKCSKCNIEINKKNTSGLCNDCKTKCPSKEQLLEDLQEFKTIIAIGEKYGVSYNGVNKWIKKYEITNFKSILKNLEKN